MFRFLFILAVGLLGLWMVRAVPRIDTKRWSEEGPTDVRPSKPQHKIEKDLENRADQDVGRLHGGAIAQDFSAQDERTRLEKSLQESPDDELLIEQLAFLLTDRFQEKDQARRLFQRLIDLDPTNSLALSMFRDLSATTGELEGAAAFLENIAGRCQSCSELQLVNSDILIVLRRGTEARDILKSLEGEPLSEAEARMLSSLYERLGEADLARTWLQSAVDSAQAELSPNQETEAYAAWLAKDRAALRQMQQQASKMDVN